jgi:hypothetical protein
MMAAHTPTAWDLDVRSFMSDLLRGPSSGAFPVPDRSLICVALAWADAVQKARDDRVRKLFTETPGDTPKVERRSWEYAPDKLPASLPIGTRVYGDNETALSVVELRKVDDRAVYYGRWSRFEHDGWVWTSDIDWEHWSRTAPPEPK